MSHNAHSYLDQIRSLSLPPRFRILNVCGGHERAISVAGLRTILPAQLELIPGPGCPVCVCPEEDIYAAMQLALQEHVVVAAFGDMLRVPVNVPKSEPRSLEQAKAAGGKIYAVASPREVRDLALLHAKQPVVFFAAGFETTIAPVAALLAEGIPDNLSLLLSGRLTWPAVEMLLASGKAQFDALVAPGHVAAVMGADEWRFVPERYTLPCAVAGFTPDSLLAAFYSCLRQTLTGRVFLDNCYRQVVNTNGNLTARHQLSNVMEVIDANWRGIGIIPASGFALREAWQAHDARRIFPDYAGEVRQRRGTMPPGCDCAAVVLGQRYPNQCALYGTACTPRQPVGPCMVSDEGACRIWWTNVKNKLKRIT